MKSMPNEKILYAVLSGLMLTASFPPGRGEWFVWIAFIPLLIAIETQSNRNRFMLGLITGMTHYLTLMYWVIIVLNRYGGLPWPVSLSVLILLSFYLALYFALFCLGVGFFSRSLFPGLTLSLFWVSLEFIRAKILTGFPWCLLGYTQFRHLPLIQITDISGVYGISFLIVFANILIFSLFVSVHRGKRIRRLSEVFLFLLFILSVLYYGYSWLEKKGTQIETGNHYTPASYKQETIRHYHELTRQTLALKPRLIVWPETAVPFFFQTDEPLADTVRQIAIESDAHLIFGTPAFGYEAGALKYFNRAYHLDPKGKTRGFYDKVHLVPFGEYVPLERFLPFIQRLVTSAGNFTPGSKMSPLPVGGISVGLLICFESIFPEIARSHTRQNADLLVNISNDAWYGHSSAPYQTLTMSVFRAIENRRPLIRAANTGFSAVIDHRGEVLAKTDLFSREIRIKEIPLVEPFMSFYTQYGDLFATGCLIVTFIILILNLRGFIFKNFRKNISLNKGL